MWTDHRAPKKDTVDIYIDKKRTKTTPDVNERGMDVWPDVQEAQERGEG